MNYLSETYDCKMDDKGRVKLPVSVFKSLETFGEGYFMIKKSVFENCLEFYPQSSWEKLTVELYGTNIKNRENARFVRAITASAKRVDLDGAGRLQLSKDLIADVGIVKDVVFKGSGDFYEIWEKTQFEDVANISQEDLVIWMEKNLGNKKDENVS